tara:strand:+ start:1328 stop:1555 length:228 start_codon:yes stop_codon:yes gene_type:complete
MVSAGKRGGVEDVVEEPSASVGKLGHGTPRQLNEMSSQFAAVPPSTPGMLHLGFGFEPLNGMKPARQAYNASPFG